MIAALDLPALLTAAATFIVAVATLVTALRTHGAVRTANGTTIGEAIDEIGRKQTEAGTGDGGPSDRVPGGPTR